jgi:hypothetical protein
LPSLEREEVDPIGLDPTAQVAGAVDFDGKPLSVRHRCRSLPIRRELGARRAFEARRGLADELEVEDHLPGQRRLTAERIREIRPTRHAVSFDTQAWW